MQNHWGDHVGDVLAEILAEIKQPSSSETERMGSRYLGPNADKNLAAHVAKGGTVESLKVAPRSFGAKAWGGGGGGLARSMKALAEGTGSSGGYLVPAWVSAEILALVRSQSAVMQMKPRVLQVGKEMLLTSLSSGATAYYLAGENSSIPPSEETFDQAPLLKPTELGALVPISLRLLRDADDNPDVEDIIREDLAEVMALRQDLAFLRGTGTLGEPRGVLNTPGLTPGPTVPANGVAVTFSLMKEIVASVRDAGAAMRRPGFILHPKVVSALDRLTDADGHFFSESDNLLKLDEAGTRGTVGGVPFVTSRQIPTNLTRGASTNATEIYFGDWSEAFIGENQGLVIETSGDASYTPDGGTTWVSAFQNRQQLFRALMAHDFNLRRPDWFSVTVGALV